MPVRALHHYTLRCTPAELDPLLDFYTERIGLTVGARPPIPAPGYWLYSEGQPIVHLYAYMDESERPPPGRAVTGPLDHISFRARGLARTRREFDAAGLHYDEAPVPDWPLHQVFVHDPKGLRIELTFWMEEEADEEGAEARARAGVRP
jgi:catechol 2,3-dioxygenase-like lactoylglutathione lyase family enzyme